MTARKCIAKRIPDLCDERRMSINALARSASIPPATVKFFDTEDFRVLKQEKQ